MGWVNDELAHHFGQIADLLKLTGADRFRIRAYERARDAIGASTADLGALDPDQLAAIKGIGGSTAKKILEYRKTGTIAMLEELRAKVPPGLLELTRVPGLGPKTARQLHESLGVDSLAALERALEAGRIRTMPGAGEKTEANLRAALARMGAKDANRAPLADVIAVAEELCRRLRQQRSVLAAEVAGSVRRVQETIGDVDLLVATTDPASVMAAVRADDLVREVIAAGEARTSVRTVRDLQVDLRAVAPESWGAALIYFTGSKAHNVRIRERAVRRGLTLSEYGLFRRDGGERVAGRTEEEVYAALGLSWIPPTMRQDTGEVEAAADGRLPAVVTRDQLRGDLHGHSHWSGDGKATLDDMVRAAGERGLRYWSVTDHAAGLPLNGLSQDQFLARRGAIAALRAQFDIAVLDGVELNIDGAGGLDYDDEFLAAFDVCVASIHTLMDRDASAQTERMVTAMRHPSVHVIGHPTGRKIGIRPGYELQVDRVLEAALETGTALEVNASPRRLDLSGELVRRAVDAGVTLAISSDAHSIGDLDHLRFGIATAQRGWATAADILNCRDAGGLAEFVGAKRRGGRR